MKEKVHSALRMAELGVLPTQINKPPSMLGRTTTMKDLPMPLVDKCYPWILAASMDDCAHWSDPCTRLIAASDAAAATNNRHHPWIITSSIRG